MITLGAHVFTDYTNEVYSFCNIHDLCESNIFDKAMNIGFSY